MTTRLLAEMQLAKPAEGQRALWTSTPEDPVFERSPVRVWMDAFVDAAETVEGFVWSDLMQAVDLTSHAQEEPLPARRARVDLAWDAGRVAVTATASMDEGILPRFPADVPASARVDVLRALARAALHYRERERSSGIAPSSPCAGRTYWERVKDAHALAGDPSAPVLVLDA